MKAFVAGLQSCVEFQQYTLASPNSAGYSDISTTSGSNHTIMSIPPASDLHMTLGHVDISGVDLDAFTTYDKNNLALR